MKNLNEKKKNIITIVLSILFAGMFIAGSFTGEADTVMTKAINICMECIGIG